MTMISRELENLPKLKVGTSPTLIKIIGGPYIQFSVWGYIPVLHIVVDKSGLEYLLPISAKSLATPLNDLFLINRTFKDIQIELRKASEEPKAPYEVNSVNPKKAKK